MPQWQFAQGELSMPPGGATYFCLSGNLRRMGMWLAEFEVNWYHVPDYPVPQEWGTRQAGK